MKILLCTDGSDNALKAAKWLKGMHLARQAQITLLGVEEEKSAKAAIPSSFDKIEAIIGSEQPEIQRITKQGSFVKLIEVVARACKRIAIAGASRKPNKFGNAAYKELKARGWKEYL